MTRDGTATGADRPSPAQRARELFLTDHNTHGCAEVALVALQEHYGMADAGDSSAAMALNGGIAYSGATCGALTGAALALGRLAGERVPDHREAKRTARTLLQALMVEFDGAFGAVDCRDLTGYDMTTQHEAFIASGVWRRDCMRQIEFVVGRLEPLLDGPVWDEAATTGTLPDPP